MLLVCVGLLLKTQLKGIQLIVYMCTAFNEEYMLPLVQSCISKITLIDFRCKIRPVSFSFYLLGIFWLEAFTFYLVMSIYQPIHLSGRMCCLPLFRVSQRKAQLLPKERAGCLERVVLDPLILFPCTEKVVMKVENFTVFLICLHRIAAGIEGIIMPGTLRKLEEYYTLLVQEPTSLVESIPCVASVDKCVL